MHIHTQGGKLGRTPTFVIVYLPHHKTLCHWPVTTRSPLWVQPPFPKLSPQNVPDEPLEEENDSPTTEDSNVNSHL